MSTRNMLELPSPRATAHQRLDALMDADPRMAEQVCCILAAFQIAPGSIRTQLLREATQALMADQPMPPAPPAPQELSDYKDGLARLAAATDVVDWLTITGDMELEAVRYLVGFDDTLGPAPTSTRHHEAAAEIRRLRAALDGQVNSR